ncbi:MotE family protein [Nitrospira sp. BLG_2]|uniref:MotE family protein n=1 Tax=Nitrospira sp. BLG_2 TaxID=3397507 RepID=UPI003B9B11DF
MKTRSIKGRTDYFSLASRKHAARTVLRANRHSQLWTMIGGIFGSTILFWIMVQLGQASSEPKYKTQPVATSELGQTAPPSAPDADGAQAELDDDAKLFAPPVVQGPAIDFPREVLDMMEQRKRDLDRREQSIRQNEERLMIVRSQVEELLDQNEALEKKIQSAQAKIPAQQAKLQAEKERLAQDQRTQLAKIYESMPSEDAASRLERMPDRKAIEILRMVKAKTAGAILAQVKADRAAKLTEQLLAQTP